MAKKKRTPSEVLDKIEQMAKKKLEGSAFLEVRRVGSERTAAPDSLVGRVTIVRKGAPPATIEYFRVVAHKNGPVIAEARDPANGSYWHGAMAERFELSVARAMINAIAKIRPN